MGAFAAVVLVGILGAVERRPFRPAGTAPRVAILCVVSVVQAQSRGAMIAGFAGVSVLAWIRNRPLAVAFVGVGVVAAALIYPAFVAVAAREPPRRCHGRRLRGDVESDDARLNASLAGPAMFLAEPIFGVGFGQYVAKSVEISGLDTGINAHNWYINVLAEQGTTGGLLWLGAIVAGVVELRARRGVARRIGIGVFTILDRRLRVPRGPGSRSRSSRSHRCS